jgi:hypothetical protein
MGRGGEEDGMSDTTPALDEAFERMAAASFELPNGFVNHGAMACEALAMLDCAGDIDSWARRFARAGGASVDPVAPAGSPGPSSRPRDHEGAVRRRVIVISESCPDGGRCVPAAAVR